MWVGEGGGAGNPAGVFFFGGSWWFLLLSVCFCCCVLFLFVCVFVVLVGFCWFFSGLLRFAFWGVLFVFSRILPPPSWQEIKATYLPPPPVKKHRGDRWVSIGGNFPPCSKMVDARTAIGQPLEKRILKKIWIWKSGKGPLKKTPLKDLNVFEKKYLNIYLVLTEHLSTEFLAAAHLVLSCGASGLPVPP